MTVAQPTAPVGVPRRPAAAARAVLAVPDAGHPGHGDRRPTTGSETSRGFTGESGDRSAASSRPGRWPGRRASRPCRPTSTGAPRSSCCSLVTGQVSDYADGTASARRSMTWENVQYQPLYQAAAVPPGRAQGLGRGPLHLPGGGIQDPPARDGRPARADRGRQPGVDIDVFRPAARADDRPRGGLRLAAGEEQGDRPGARGLRAGAREHPRGPAGGDGPRSLGGAGPAGAQPTPAGGSRLVGAGEAAAVAETLRRAAVFVTAPRMTW